MVTTHVLVLFLAASLALNITPGPDMLYVLGRSLAQGRRIGVISALGIGAGTLVHIGAAALGLSAVLMASATAYQLVKWAGAVYLVVLGIRMLRESSGPSLRELPPVSAHRAFTQAIITNVLNPKVALFFLAFLPQFIDRSHGSPAAQIVFLGLLFNFGGTLVNSTVAMLSGALRSWLQSSPRVARAQNTFCGAIFIALGARLAFSKPATGH